MHRGPADDRSECGKRDRTRSGSMVGWINGYECVRETSDFGFWVMFREALIM